MNRSWLGEGAGGSGARLKGYLMCLAHEPSVNRQTHRTENIISSKTTYAGVHKNEARM